MDKLLLLVVPLFCTNLVVAHPITLKRMSEQLKTGFKGIGYKKIMRVNNIHEKCEKIEICELLYNDFRLCKKIYKCTQ